ncbi:MAG: polysaccharide lyase 6 family protein [Planctomycetota bacterium]
MNQLVLRISLIFMTLLLLSENPALGAEYGVASAEDITRVMEQARPGDILVMQDGTWTDQEVHFAGKGDENAPITLRPQTPGGVTLTGRTELYISGKYLVVDGLQFRKGTPGKSSHIIQFRGRLGEAEYCRLTNTVIDSCNPPDGKTKYHWVSLYGRHNRVDHCRFKNHAHKGVTIVAWLNGKPAYHRIDRNHFMDRPPAPNNANGYETIRLGTSGRSMTKASITVEYNLFERVDGEVEIISSKSCDNTFRFNTLRESAGTLTLRHGHRAKVEGNYFLGMGKAKSGGIRVIGEDHVIIHNYIADIDDQADAAISLAAGIRNTKPSGYQQVKRTRIEHNTIVNVRGAGITFDWGLGSRKRRLIPENLTISNNVLYSTSAPSLEGGIRDNWVWSNNIVFGAEPGIKLNEGIQVIDPVLEKGPDGLWRPTAKSPALHLGAALPPADKKKGNSSPADGDGVIDGEAPYRLSYPLTSKDVGPDWSD